MPTDAWLKAAKAENRQPVVLMAAESPAALIDGVGTQAEWEACSPLTNISTSEIPGSVVPSYPVTPGGTSGAYIYSRSITPAIDAFFRTNPSITARVSGSVPGGDHYGIAGDVTAVVRQGSSGGTIVATSEIYHTTLMPSINLGGASITLTLTIPAGAIVFLSPPTLSAGTAYYIEFIWTPTDGASVSMTGWIEKTLVLTPKLATDCTLTTGVIDLGEQPIAASTLKITDTAAYGSAVTYTVYAHATTNPPTTSLGTFTDGETITGSGGCRYFRVKASFTSTNGVRAQVQEIQVVGGDDAVEYYGTHRDLPFAGVRPYLSPNPLSNISSKIDLVKPSTTGEVSVSMPWTDEIDTLISNDGFKNKDVKLSLGFVGLPAGDYEPLFTGFWYDYAADPNSLTISVTLRDVLKKFKARKLPEEITRDNSDQAVTPIHYVAANVIDIMLDLMDRLGIPDRLVPSGSYTSIRDADYSAAQWDLTRSISSPADAFDLLNELAVTAGLFLSPQADGTLMPYQYDTSASVVDILDAGVGKVGKIAGGQKELFTRQKVYYDAQVDDPGSADDYGQLHVVRNLTVETATGEVAEKEWFDKWGIGATVAEAIADRWDGWFANPHHTLTISELPLRYLHVQPGQLVSIDNLKIPGETTVGRKYLVMSRALNTGSWTVSLSLYDTETSGSAGASVVATTLAISGSATPSGATNTYTVTGGTAPYFWESTLGTLSATSGSSVNLDVSSAYGEGAIKVSDATGAVVKYLENAAAVTVEWENILDGSGTRPADNAAVNAPSLGVKKNYSSPTVSSPGEIFLHGFDTSGDPANVDGWIEFGGAKTTVPKGYLNPDAEIDGYIVFDTALNGHWNGQSLVCAIKSGGVWTAYYHNDSGGTSDTAEITPTADMCVIGTFSMASAESVESAHVWGSGMSLSVAAESGATANTGALADKDAADWSTEITGTGKPADNADVTGDNVALGVTTAASGKRIVVTNSDGELHFYADRGDGTVEEIGTIGIKSSGGDTIIADFGNANTQRTALRCWSNTSSPAAYIYNDGSGYGLVAWGDSSAAIAASSASGEDVLCGGTGIMKLGVVYSSGSPLPTAASALTGALALYNNGSSTRPVYCDGSNWRYVHDNSTV